jgi:hypothetical protein
MKDTNAATVESRLQLSISAQAVGIRQTLLSFHHTKKHDVPSFSSAGFSTVLPELCWYFTWAWFSREVLSAMAFGGK